MLTLTLPPTPAISPLPLGNLQSAVPAPSHEHPLPASHPGATPTQPPTVPLPPVLLSLPKPRPWPPPRTLTPGGGVTVPPHHRADPSFAPLVRGEGTSEEEEEERECAGGSQIDAQGEESEGAGRQENVVRKSCVFFSFLIFLFIFSPGRTRLHSSVCNFFLHAKITRPIC